MRHGNELQSLSRRIARYRWGGNWAIAELRHGIKVKSGWKGETLAHGRGLGVRIQTIRAQEDYDIDVEEVKEREMIRENKAKTGK